MPPVLLLFLWINAERSSHFHPFGPKSTALWISFMLIASFIYLVAKASVQANCERWVDGIFAVLLLVLLPAFAVHSLPRQFWQPVLALSGGLLLMERRAACVRKLEALERASLPISDAQLAWGDTLTLGVVSMGFYTLTLGLKVAIESPIGWTLAILLWMIPLIAWLASQMSAILLKEKSGAARSVRFIFVGWSIGASLCITALMLLVGHELAPTVSAPQTMRLLLSNTICDSVTIVATLRVLEAGIQRQRRGGLVFAVLLCVILGSALAGASVWIGVTSLSFVETARIFIARSIDGAHWEIGPYFWVMHSTFLPLLLLIALLLLGWSGKLMIISFEKFLGRAQHEDVNGLNMTSRYLGVISALSGLAVAVLSLLI
jgi:hypothetical protein